MVHSYSRQTSRKSIVDQRDGKKFLFTRLILVVGSNLRFLRNYDRAVIVCFGNDFNFGTNFWVFFFFIKMF